MRSLALALLATLAAVSGLAQADPLRSTGGDEKAFAKLRGITFFFIDVTTSESRPEDADLRGEIRDAWSSRCAAPTSYRARSMA